MALVKIAHGGDKNRVFEGAQVLAQFCESVGYFHGVLVREALAWV